MKKRYLGLLALATVLTSGLAVVNEHGFNKVDAAEGTATYTITSSSSVTSTGAPQGTSATFNNTYTSNKQQLTKNNSMTLTLSGYDGMTITGLTLSMKSNKSGGSGTLSVKVGDTSIASISSATAFNNSAWNGAYTTKFVDVNPKLTSNPVVGQGEDIVITIAATANSLYCQSFTISYIAPDVTDEPVDKTEEVNSLFIKYYGEGTYTKLTTLNVDSTASMVASDLRTYFHAGAQKRYRATIYEGDEDGASKLTMRTSEDGNVYSKDQSIYENGDEEVVHSGQVGGNYTYSTETIKTVEAWFNTLYDFKNSPLTGWVENNGVFVFDLLIDSENDSEEVKNAKTEMKTMAREFVSPMWLANSTAANYLVFNKLTVEEVNEQLVMKLWVPQGDSTKLVAGAEKDSGNNYVFAQAIISSGIVDLDVLKLELTVDSLGLESNNYSSSTTTVSNVELEWIQLGNYGNGIQVRDKDGKTSSLWNTTGLSGNITKIEFEYASTKPNTYNNQNMTLLYFGNSVKPDGTEYATTLSTTSGVQSYTVEVEGDYNYFYFEHDNSYSAYWDSITIYYSAD